MGLPHIVVSKFWLGGGEAYARNKNTSARLCAEGGAICGTLRYDLISVAKLSLNQVVYMFVCPQIRNCKLCVPLISLTFRLPVRSMCICVIVTVKANTMV